MESTRKPSHPAHQKANLVTSIPGPKSQAIRAREDQHLAPGLQGFALMAGIVVDKAEGSAVTDVDGNTMIDIIGGIGVNGLGHSHPTVVQAIKSQVEKASVGSFTSEARVELLERIAKNRPAPLVHRTQLYSSGAEAVESALRLAKCHTGKYEFVSFWGGFHGKTQGALSLMGSDFKDKLGPMVSGSHIVPYANCYRCPMKLKYPSCGMACVELMRKQVKMSCAGRIAAFIAEPMQGTAGNVIPPKEFLPAVKEVAKEMGALMIVDEMITGFGRTGKYWGAWHSGVEADIVTLGKQFGGGFPISALISTDEIANAKPWSTPSGSSSSYGGNPLAAASAAAATRAIEEEGLVENSRRMGEYFLAKLKPFEEKFSFIGEVRGAGLFLAVEMVKDKQSKEPLTKTATNRIFMECLKRGLLTMAYAASFRIQPAMTIDAGTIDEAVRILDEVFTLAEKEGFWKG
jgi:4-aminobutyrate aminotransferase-like enzyme